MSNAASGVGIPAHVPPDLVMDFDFRNDPRLRADPWSVFNAMNDKPDIFFSPALGGYWVVTRAELVAEVMRRYDLFSVRNIGIPVVQGAPVVIPNNLDPPVHAKYRRILSQQMFSPQALGSVEQDSRQLTRTLLERFERSGACEFVEAYARPLPVLSFLQMMDLPSERLPEFMSWIRGIFHSAATEERAAGFQHAHQFLSHWLDERMTGPLPVVGGHMLAALLTAQVDGRRLTKDEMLSIALMLLVGGLDTVTSQMTHIVRFLAESPPHRQRVIDDPACIPDALEELLRRFGISNIARTVARDCTFHGVALKEDDSILCSTPIANLDARVFPAPLAVDFDRPNRKDHWAFGAGIHLCPGAYLARVQIRVMLEEVLPRLPHVRLAPRATIEYVSGGTLAIKALPLVWDAPAV